MDLGTEFGAGVEEGFVDVRLRPSGQFPKYQMLFPVGFHHAAKLTVGTMTQRPWFGT